MYRHRGLVIQASAFGADGQIVEPCWVLDLIWLVDEAQASKIEWLPITILPDA